MKAVEARKLIGQTVRITKRGFLHDYTMTVTIMEVRGRNVLVDHQGMTDWLWLPDLKLVRQDEQ